MDLAGDLLQAALMIWPPLVLELFGVRAVVARRIDTTTITTVIADFDLRPAPP